MLVALLRVVRHARKHFEGLPRAYTERFESNYVDYTDTGPHLNARRVWYKDLRRERSIE